MLYVGLVVHRKQLLVAVVRRRRRKTPPTCFLDPPLVQGAPALAQMRACQFTFSNTKQLNLPVARWLLRPPQAMPKQLLTTTMLRSHNLLDRCDQYLPDQTYQVEQLKNKNTFPAKAACWM